MRGTPQTLHLPSSFWRGAECGALQIADAVTPHLQAAISVPPFPFYFLLYPFTSKFKTIKANTEHTFLTCNQTHVNTPSPHTHARIIIIMPLVVPGLMDSNTNGNNSTNYDSEQEEWLNKLVGKKLTDGVSDNTVCIFSLPYLLVLRDECAFGWRWC